MLQKLPMAQKQWSNVAPSFILKTEKGGDLVKVEIQIDPQAPEPRAIIITPSMTDQLAEKIKQLSSDEPHRLTGNREDHWELLEEEEIIRIYAQQGKVTAVTPKGSYHLRQRLYELEERLNPHWFVRISHSEIIHLKHVKRFDVSLAGTVCISLSNGETAYASRRYVSKIKQILGI